MICEIIVNLPVSNTVALAKVLLDAPNGVCELCHNVYVVKCFLHYGPESAQKFVRESWSSRSKLQTQAFASCHRLYVHSQRAFPRDCEFFIREYGADARRICSRMLPIHALMASRWAARQARAAAGQKSSFGGRCNQQSVL